MHGTNDAAEITGTPSDSVTDAGGVANAFSASRTPNTTSLRDWSSDVCTSDLAAAAGSATDHGYGTYEMTAAGTWTYTLDNSNATVQGLNVRSEERRVGKETTFRVSAEP